MNWDSILKFLSTAGVDLLRGLLTLVIGLFIVHWVMRLFERYEQKLKIEDTLKGFIKNLLRILLYVLVIITAANTMGVPMTSIITLLGSAGVAISLALQGVLGNLIGGFILLVFKPIKAGEYVMIEENEGTVKAVGTFYTELTTFDGKNINLPNGTLTKSAIINYSREGIRRLEQPYSISYDTDMDYVYEVFNRAISEEKAALTDPAPSVVLSKCADSGMLFTVRVWVREEDYWDAHYRMLDRCRRSLAQAGITIPYPQMDVHMK